MQPILEGIDEITDEVTQLVNKISEEFSSSKEKLLENDEQTAAWMLFHLGREYFQAARDELLKNRVTAGGSLVRSCIENAGDAFYIYDTPNKLEKYCKAYVASMEAFRKVMLDSVGKASEDIHKSRVLKHANKWTNANIEDRVLATGPSFSNIYDLFSYFSHPNPGALTYMGNPRLRSAQINLLKQTNSLTMLSLIGVVLNHVNLTLVTHQDLKTVIVKINPNYMSDVSSDELA